VSLDRPVSGSRWEPAAPPPTQPSYPTEPPSPGTLSSPSEPSGIDEYARTLATQTNRPHGMAEAPAPPARSGRKALLAGVAIVLLGLGGVGGYWIGHSTAAGSAPARATTDGHRHGGLGRYGYSGAPSGAGPGAAGAGIGNTSNGSAAT
jgi:hypothetical protein